MLNLAKLPVRKSNVALRVSKGHFATNHSHINYLIDVTFQKSRLSEAQAVAKALVKQYVTSTIVDTIVCLDGMQVVGACLAEELTKKVGYPPVYQFQIGAAIAINAGPRVVGAIFETARKKLIKEEKSKEKNA